jgi:hypothetical protein
LVWASTDIIPSNLTVQPQFSTGFHQVDNDVTIKIAPLNSGGTKFDFTAATGLTLLLSNSPTIPAQFGIVTTIAPVIVTADNTGLVFKMLAADLTTLGAGIGSLSGSLSLSATDGATSILVARGTILYQLVP